MTLTTAAPRAKGGEGAWGEAQGVVITCYKPFITGVGEEVFILLWYERGGGRREEGKRTAERGEDQGAKGRRQDRREEGEEGEMNKGGG